MYGTLKDFQHLARDARKHDIRIIMDFVLNHTSLSTNGFLIRRHRVLRHVAIGTFGVMAKGPASPE